MAFDIELVIEDATDVLPACNFEGLDVLVDKVISFLASKWRTLELSILDVDTHDLKTAIGHRQKFNNATLVPEGVRSKVSFEPKLYSILVD